jgi:hypothetical protein
MTIMLPSIVQVVGQAKQGTVFAFVCFLTAIAEVRETGAGVQRAQTNLSSYCVNLIT